MPKPVLATAQDLKDEVNKLTSELQRVQSLIDPAVKACETTLNGKCQQLEQRILAASQQASSDVEKCKNESKDYTNQSCKALHQQILPEFVPIKASIQSTTAMLTEMINGVDADVRQTMKTELQELCNKFDEELSSLKNQLAADIEKMGTECAEELVKQRSELNAELEAMFKKVEDDDTRDREAEAQAFSDFKETQSSRDETQDQKSERAQGEIYVKIGLLDEKLTEAMRKLDEETKEVHSLHVAEYAAFEAKTERHFDVVDDDTRCLRNAMSEVENVTTRKVEWVIKDVSSRIRPLTPSRSMLHTSWFSPKFDAAGAHGLQLELQLFRNGDPAVDGEDAGDVAIHLWACKGMQMSYVLSCGTKAAPVLEKTFNGRVPYGTKRFWFLHDQINKEDDTLTVSVEIQEAVRTVEHVIKPPVAPIQDPDAPPPTLEEIYKQEQIMDKALDGSIYFSRWTNNRLYDQVKSQVDIMQSRMVRKIEWRVESASALRRCFPANECLCSAAFSAAGVEGMQFVFYPSGYKNCTDGYCSLFLYGPAGATLKCFLSAGEQKREASHSFDEPGAFGRTNFCRFESCVDDTTDSILIVLDIEDAQQDWSAHTKHPHLIPGDRRTIQQIDGSSDKPIQSVVKLTKKPGARASGKDANLIEVKVLPSLWTAKQIGDSISVPDGMHKFDEVRARGGPAADRGARQRSQFSMGSSMMQGSSMVQGTSSMPTMPTLRDDSMRRTALEEDVFSPPLPQLSKTFSDGKDFATVRKAGRPKQATKLGASMTAM
jgi:hypothetical protein